MANELVVVGSGGAALTSALHAAMRGASVTVLEAAPVFGGTTALSGGTLWAPLNRVCKDAFGLEDSPEEVLKYLEACTLGLVAHETLESFVRHSPQFIEFLIANTACEVAAGDQPDYYMGRPGAVKIGRSVAIGLYDTSRLGEFQKLLREPPQPGGMPPTSTQELHAADASNKDLRALFAERRAKGIAGRGRALIGGLMEACLEHGVRLIHSARATSATSDKEGRVTAVQALVEGSERNFPADLGVVLACGGFEWNRTMWNGLIGVPLDGPLSPPFNVGDGFRIAAKAGARIGNTNQVWWNTGIGIPGETYDGKPRMRGAGMRSRLGSITVNRQGKRFFNENMQYNDAGRPLTHFDPHTYSFPNYPAYCIADYETFNQSPLLGYDQETPVSSEWLFEAPTLRELAEKIGVNADGLQQQVKDWNAACEKGVDPDFHRGEYDYDLTRRGDSSQAVWEAAHDQGSPSTPNGLLQPVTSGPYYAHQLKAICYGTKAGPVIDGDGRVVDYDDNPVPGLFAAGSTTAVIFGHSYPGAGGTLGSALVMGWAAGKAATS